ncbi:MAG TPA: hypothetical protein VG759_27700 [Candidatus Angelobacter sp.]|jgi:hypothetical protein|nr:hypothetical protein [Candidatus Angelobacter sp.]
MENRFKPSRALGLALLLAAVSISTGAQMTSKAGHITIIAIMPENLSLSLNSSGALYSASAGNRTEIPGVATGVTTGWSLMQGRAKVATFVTMDRTNVPMIIADASGYGVSPFADERDRQPHRFSLHPNHSNTQLSGSNLTESNRRGANTAALPDSGDPGQPQRLPANLPAGTLKIQVQPVL